MEKKRSKLIRSPKRGKQKKFTEANIDYGVAKNDFHQILDKASQPIKKPKSDEEKS